MADPAWRPDLISDGDWPGVGMRCSAASEAPRSAACWSSTSGTPREPVVGPNDPDTGHRAGYAIDVERPYVSRRERTSVYNVGVTPEEASLAMKPAVVELGAAFGDDHSFIAYAERIGLGVDRWPLYFGGRAGVLGEVPADVVALRAASSLQTSFAQHGQPRSRRVSWTRSSGRTSNYVCGGRASILRAWKASRGQHNSRGRW